MTSELELLAVRYEGPQAQALIAEIQQEYVERYGGPDETPLSDEEFAPPLGGFFIAVLDAVPVGCAGLRRHDEETVELKRLYVRSAYRRRGLATALLGAVENQARALGYRRLILETGSKQPEAIALYQGRGYSPGPAFGRYQDAPHSLWFTVSL
jgi:GNAT superfamily N-acetyltransferase